MKQTPKHLDQNHINYLKDKYGSLDKNKKEIVGNPNGGESSFWILYVVIMIAYVIHIFP
jgi:hypothetical protein